MTRLSVWITHQLPYTAFAGDWMLHRCSSTVNVPRCDQRVHRQSILRGTWQLAEHRYRPHASRPRRSSRTFLAHCLAAGPGTTTTSSASRRRSSRTSRRSRWPSAIKAAASAHARSCSAAPTGKARWGTSSTGGSAFVDYVCSGEAENSLFRRSSATCMDRRADDDMPADDTGPRLSSGRCNSVATGPLGSFATWTSLPVSGLRRLLPRSRCETRAAPTSCRRCCSRRRAAAGGAPSRTARSAV